MTKKKETFGPTMGETPVGQYYLLDKIAQGGMAEIYKGLAYDLHGIKKTVVIKKILPQISADPEFINMLINEAKIAVMLSHGNIAQIYDLGKVGDDYFMVMEFVDGKSLSQIHKRCLKMGKTIPIEFICYLISEVASGLNYMHRRSDEQGRNLGIIHRDISPQNVIVSYSGTVKIIDFGIAKAAIQINITDSGVLKGKFAYMAPEQASGEMVDHRTDIFSLGVVLHELLTDKRLFKGENKKETIQNVRRAIVPPPSSLKKDLPKGLDEIVLKALAKDPKRRYMWASELRDDLTRFIHTNYPKFKASLIGDYVRELFREEMSEKEEPEEDAKTPFLIIDHTQSSILPENLEATGISKIPPQLREFMLDEDTPITKMKADEIEEEIPEIKPKKIRKPLEIKKFFSSHWRGVFGSFAAITLITISALLLAMDRGYIKTPKVITMLARDTTLTIEVDPPDAKVFIGEIALPGETTFKLNKIRPNSEIMIAVEKDGYVPYKDTLMLAEGEDRDLEIILQKEAPRYAEIIVRSEPPGATIFLNEKNTSLVTPATVSHLEPNAYSNIGLYLEGFDYWSKDYKTEPDGRIEISANLMASWGQLEIISTPEVTDVYINGGFAGTTPLKLKKLRPDEIMDIVVKKPGFIEWNERVMIKAGQTLTLRPNLPRTQELLTPEYLRNLDHPKEEVKEPTAEVPTEAKPETPNPPQLLPPAQ